MTELRPGRIEAGREYKLPRRLKRDLAPGTFTFILDSGMQWDVIFTFAIIVAVCALPVNAFVLLAFVDRFDLQGVQALAPTIALGCLTGIYLTIRGFWKNRHPRARVVFYQPRATHPGQSYRAPPVDSRPRFEVYFRGKLRESGYVTHDNLRLDSFSSEATFNHITRIAVDGWIVLSSELGPPDPADPLSSIRTNWGSYHVYVRINEVDSTKCEQMMDELQEFLGLHISEDTGYSQSDYEAFLEEELKKRMGGGGKSGNSPLASTVDKPQELEERERRRHARVEGLQARLKMMRRKDGGPE